MSQLLSPAIALMNRLRYAQKFVLISLLFIVPLALVIALLIAEVNTKADFAQKEQAGTEYLRGMRRLLDDTLHEQAIAHVYINGDLGRAAEFQRAQTQLDDDLAALGVLDRRLGASLKSTESLSALNADWRELKSKLPQINMRTSDDLHAALIADIRGLIGLVGNTSNLILDPDLDSYYAMDAVLLKLPENQDLLAKTRMLGERIIIQQRFASDDKAQLTILSGVLRSNISAIVQGMDVAFANNPSGNMQPALSAALQDVITTNQTLLEQIDRGMIYAPTIAIQQEAYRALAEAALQRSFTFWDRTVDTLDQVLQARIDDANQKKNLVGIVTALVLALVLYLWVAFYVAVRRTVAGLDVAAQRMIRGAMSQAIQLDSRDELGDVARSFNSVASALISSSAYRQAVVDNAVNGIITVSA
ncbi:MAG: hypothetical protein M3R61_06635 [Chloroflexota bacterium]|nr:hypothetical protein [Chloroflexota bacterium]